MKTIIVKTFAEYQKAAMRTCTESSRNMDYMAVEVISEAGEVAGKVAKMIRDKGKLDASDNELRRGLILELGDVMWGVAGICELKGIDLRRAFGYELDNTPGYNREVDVAQRVVLLCCYASELANFARMKDEDMLNLEYGVKHAVRCVNELATIVGSSLHDVCNKNVAKLASRRERGVIEGSGDYR